MSECFSESSGLLLQPIVTQRFTQVSPAATPWTQAGQFTDIAGAYTDLSNCTSRPFGQSLLAATAVGDNDFVYGDQTIDFTDVIEMTTYHVQLQQHWMTFVKVKDEFVHAPYPTWTAVGVTELARPGALIEVKVTARLRS